ARLGQGRAACGVPAGWSRHIRDERAVARPEWLHIGRHCLVVHGGPACPALGHLGGTEAVRVSERGFASKDRARPSTHFMSGTVVQHLRAKAIDAARAMEVNAMKINIGEMPLGAKPVGFTQVLTGQGGGVQWQVLDDPSAPARKVIAETSRDTADYRFPLCIW